MVDSVILGKPADSDDATRMLRMLSGRTHQVITGVCVVSSTGSTNSAISANTSNSKIENCDLRTSSETTLVTFSALTDVEIHDYVGTGEPMDKAGAYAIQGIASRWIPRIEGDYSNVVGLPVARVYRMLQELNRGWT